MSSVERVKPTFEHLELDRPASFSSVRVRAACAERRSRVEEVSQCICFGLLLLACSGVCSASRSLFSSPTDSRCYAIHESASTDAAGEAITAAAKALADLRLVLLRVVACAVVGAVHSAR